METYINMTRSLKRGRILEVINAMLHNMSIKGDEGATTYSLKCTNDVNENYAQLLEIAQQHQQQAATSSMVVKVETTSLDTVSAFVMTALVRAVDGSAVEMQYLLPVSSRAWLKRLRPVLCAKGSQEEQMVSLRDVLEWFRFMRRNGAPHGPPITAVHASRIIKGIPRGRNNGEDWALEWLNKDLEDLLTPTEKIEVASKGPLTSSPDAFWSTGLSEAELWLLGKRPQTTILNTWYVKASLAVHMAWRAALPPVEWVRWTTAVGAAEVPCLVDTLRARVAAIQAEASTTTFTSLCDKNKRLNFGKGILGTNFANVYASFYALVEARSTLRIWIQSVLDREFKLEAGTLEHWRLFALLHHIPGLTQGLDHKRLAIQLRNALINTSGIPEIHAIIPLMGAPLTLAEWWGIPVDATITITVTEDVYPKVETQQNCLLWCAGVGLLHALPHELACHRAPVCGMLRHKKNANTLYDLMAEHNDAVQLFHRKRVWNAHLNGDHQEFIEALTVAVNDYLVFHDWDTWANNASLTTQWHQKQKLDDLNNWIQKALDDALSIVKHPKPKKPPLDPVTVKEVAERWLACIVTEGWGPIRQVSIT